jgi:serine protease Do
LKWDLTNQKEFFMSAKKSLATLTLAAAAVGAGFIGSELVQNVRFASAEAQVQTSREQLSKADDLSTVFREVSKVVSPSVVQIQVHKTIKNPHAGMDNDLLKRFFGDQGDGEFQLPDQGDLEQVGTGSGVIMETDGSDAYILTNNHVAGGATEMTITLSDGRELANAKVLGTDPKTDLAVVKVHADHLIAAKWGDSDQLAKGDWVLAFGSPLGFVGSMTHGIVSALHRTDVHILGQYGYENFIQVDAPINPGNSGGPLVNTRGEVVGINTAIASRSGGFQGIGFAIPSDQAKYIYNSLKESGKVVRGWLGVSIRDVSAEPQLAESFGYHGKDGVIVEELVPNSPATGHLKAGDIITKVNGKSITNVNELRNAIAATKPNTEDAFVVSRDGKETTATVKIGEQPADLASIRNGQHNGNQENGEENSPAATASAESLGLKFQTLTDELADKIGVTDVKGAVITNVAPNSVAAKKGLRPGDVITRVGSTTVTTAAEANNAISKANPTARGVRLYVTSKEGSRFVFLKPAAKENSAE